jgi:hypothetical protein
MERGMVRRELRSACGVGGARGCVKNARGFRFFTIRFLHAPVPSCVIPRSRVPMETIGRRHCFLLETRDPPRESRVPMETLGRRHCFLLETRDPPRESRVSMETIGRRHCFLLETCDPPRESRVPMETIGGRHCFLLETRPSEFRVSSRNITSPGTTSTTFDVGTGLMTSSKQSRIGLKQRGSGVETWKPLRVTSQKLLRRSPRLTFQTA